MNRSLFPDAPGRRVWLIDAVRCGVAIAASVLVAQTARAADKLPKSAVQYDEATRMPGRDCDDCTQFVAGAAPSAPGTCLIVAGDISPHGHCLAFTPRQKR